MQEWDHANTVCLSGWVQAMHKGVLLPHEGPGSTVFHGKEVRTRGHSGGHRVPHRVLLPRGFKGAIELHIGAGHTIGNHTLNEVIQGARLHVPTGDLSQCIHRPARYTVLAMPIGVRLPRAIKVSIAAALPGGELLPERNRHHPVSMG